MTIFLSNEVKDLFIQEPGLGSITCECN